MTVTSSQTFTLAVCNRIRELNAEIQDIEAKRKQAFLDRDRLKVEIGKCEDLGERNSLKAKRNDAIELIEELAAELKWARDQLSEAIEHADEPGLFDEPLEKPNFRLQLAEKAAKSVKKSEEEPEPDDPDQTSLDNEYETVAEAAGDEKEAPEANSYGMLPGIWEVQKAGARGRGKQHKLTDSDSFDAVILDLVGDRDDLEVDAEIDSVIVKVEGDDGDVLLKARRKGDLPPEEAPAETPKLSLSKDRTWGEGEEA